MILASYGNYSLSPPHRLPLSIPLKIAIIKNSKHAGDDGKKEGARKASLPLFLLPIVPPALSFLLLPSLPTTQRGLWGGESNYYLVASTRWRSITHISLILVNITLNRLYWSINPLDETFDLLNLLIARSWSARERSAWSEIRSLCNKQGPSSSSSLCDPWSFFRRTDHNRVWRESSIRPNLGPVNMDKSCPRYNVTRLPQLPCRANQQFIQFLTKRGEPFTWKTNDYVHPDDHAQPTYEMNPGFKHFTKIKSLTPLQTFSPCMFLQVSWIQVTPSQQEIGWLPSLDW